MASLNRNFQFKAFFSFRWVEAMAQEGGGPFRRFIDQIPSPGKFFTKVLNPKGWGRI